MPTNGNKISPGMELEKKERKKDNIWFWYQSQAYAAPVYECFILDVLNGVDQGQVVRYEEIQNSAFTKPIEFSSTLLILVTLYKKGPK